MTDQEKADIASVESPSCVNVEQPNAEKAFLEGKMLFDTSPQAQKLTDFFDRRPQLRALVRWSQNGEGFFRWADGWASRRVYFAYKRGDDLA